MKTPPKNVDEYIVSFSVDVREVLEQVRFAVHEAAPQAEETIKYGMPTFTLHGNLVYFAAYKNHIGFYPAPIGVAGFEQELGKYKTGKGSVQFPLNEPMPLAFIKKIVAYRVKVNTGKKIQGLAK